MKMKKQVLVLALLAGGFVVGCKDEPKKPAVAPATPTTPAPATTPTTTEASAGTRASDGMPPLPATRASGRLTPPSTRPSSEPSIGSSILPPETRPATIELNK
jgi:hypothetical protein